MRTEKEFRDYCSNNLYLHKALQETTAEDRCHRKSSMAYPSSSTFIRWPYA